MTKSNVTVNYKKKIKLAHPLLALGLLTLAACTTTEKAHIDTSAGLNCGLLGPGCSNRLVAGNKDQIGMRYVNPAAKWTSYRQVMISPVTFWAGDSTQISSADQQALVNYFNQQLQQELGKKFTIAQQPGPGVLKIEVAMTDAETATPLLRSITMIVPQAHMVSNLKYLATGTFPFVGGAQAEIRISDSVTGKVQAEGLDRRIGGGSFTTGFQWQWGDAENAITKWSEILSERLSTWTSGAEKP